MASKRYNIIFDDGQGYEVSTYEGGGICIKSDYGGKILELGHYQMLDVLTILDRIRDELKADKKYNNPIVKIEEDERMMELTGDDVIRILRDTADSFIKQDYFEDFTEEEKQTMKAILGSFSIQAYMALMDGDLVRLDKMAEVVSE